MVIGLRVSSPPPRANFHLYIYYTGFIHIPPPFFPPLFKSFNSISHSYLSLCSCLSLSLSLSLSNTYIPKNTTKILVIYPYSVLFSPPPTHPFSTHVLTNRDLPILSLAMVAKVVPPPLLLLVVISTDPIRSHVYRRHHSTRYDSTQRMSMPPMPH